MDLQLESIIPFFVTIMTNIYNFKRCLNLIWLYVTMLTKLFEWIYYSYKSELRDFLKESLYYLLQFVMVIVTKILFVGFKKWFCEG